MDARELFQIQLGHIVHQVENVDYSPTFDGKRLAAVLATANAGGGYCIPLMELNYTHPTSGKYLELRPDYLSFRDVTDISDRQFVYLFMWRGEGPDLNLYNAQAAPTANYTYFELHSQHYIAKSWRKAFMRLTECAFILDNIEISPNTYVTTGHVNLWWDDTNKRLKGKDSGGVTYPFGYTDRGDPSAYDYDETDLSTEGAWTDLDLSSIVPAGAKAVHLYVEIDGTTKGAALEFRKNGISNAINHTGTAVPIANSENRGDIICACSSARVVEYWRDTGITSIDLVVKGWFI